MIGIVLALVLAASPQVIEAPEIDRVSVEVRGGAAVGGVTMTGSGLESTPRGAWWVGAAYAPTDAIAVRAGFGSTSFGCEEGFCRGSTTSFASTGLDVGVRLGWSRFWAQGALVRHSLTASWSDGEEDATSSVGWEAGAGVTIPAGSRLRVTPGLRYGAYPARFSGGADDDAVAYLALDVGVRAVIRAGP
jgi:opacity protein-like surface antigen